ncbi:RmlD-like substrate binding domain-containing protein [Rhodotorula diobovata]|uniref:RmlD-like substrate binding domain-containing protein n=1 Tax=Rhodotorula diobovata TaxID=5288 RepID=A0A5C5FW72_9BASI|nr:RmlD-like substrate binding domain-containing protein [Rhodotorula diobovata]
MRVLVTGASGLLGRAVLARFKEAGHDVKGTAFSRASGDLVKLDLHDEAAVERFLEEFRPEFVVHCAAERRPDAVESDPEAAKKLNVAVPALLSSLSRSPTNPFFLLYISTDYVFDGHAPATGYEPDAETAPTNLYGESKLLGEVETLQGIEAGGKGCVLRVPVLYGKAESHSESAINTLVDAVRKAAGGQQVKMDDWATRYPTNVADVARVLVDLADKSTSTTLPSVLHFSAQQEHTKYTIAQLFAALHTPPLELGDRLVRVSEGPKPGETVRPRDCHLSNRAIEALGIDTTAVDLEAWWREYLKQEERA